MDIYTLDSGFNVEFLIEKFNTAIWTERYSASGQFVLTLPHTEQAAAALAPGSFVGCSISEEVGIVETRKVENNVIYVEGYFLTAFLRQRVIRSSFYWNVKNWAVSGSPGFIVGKIVDEMCVTGGLGTTGGSGAPIPGGVNDVISYLSVGSTATGTSIDIDVPVGDVYSACEKICLEHQLGMRLVPTAVTPTSYALDFSTYKGRDLSRDQSTYPVVSFESALDSLIKTKEIESLASYKNVCYAYAPDAIEEGGWTRGVAYTDGAASLIDFDRRVLMIFCDDITAEDVNSDVPRLTRILNKRAADALVNNNYARLLDGQIVPQLGFQYGTDYKLGDIVELKSASGLAQKARITEYIWAKDERGTVAYPTLSIVA